MKNTNQKIDLDALEAALVKSTPGEWKSRRGYIGTPNHMSYIGQMRDGAGFWGIDEMSVSNADFIALAHNALPALIAELRELRARITPEVIGEKHRDGNWWLCWEPGYEAWYKIRWQHERWQWGGGPLYGTPTHALPLPPALAARRGEVAG